MNDALTVVALGGNAISRKGEEGNIEQQFFRTQESMLHLDHTCREPTLG